MVVNGGFPPIKIESSQEKIIASQNKKRSFASSTKNKINIKRLFNQAKHKPVLTLDSNKDDLEVVDKL